MRRTLPSLTLLLLAFLAPALAAAPAAEQTSAVCPDVEPPAEEALEWEEQEPVPVSHCTERCPAQEVTCFQSSRCDAVCACGGQCLAPRFQFCAYGGPSLQSHCECFLDV